MLPSQRFPLATGAADDFRAAKSSLSERFLAPRTRTTISASALTSPTPSDNVVGVGLGEKIVNGQPTGVMAVKLLVRRKYPMGYIGADAALPGMIDGLPTDVEEVGIFRRSKTLESAAVAIQLPDPRVRMRPARPGSSIGYVDQAPGSRNAGTFGALVTDGSQRYILSNNHVIAAEDQAPTGTPIIQPGSWEGGDPGNDVVAHLTRAVPLRTDDANDVDAAIAALVAPTAAVPAVLYIGPPGEVGAAAIDMAVHKFGRTTSYTVGRVTSVDTDARVQYDRGDLVFREQIIIVGQGSRAFSDTGDSGSLIMERGTNRGVGLLFASSDTHTVANHLQAVLDALNVTLV